MKNDESIFNIMISYLRTAGFRSLLMFYKANNVGLPVSNDTLLETV